MVSKYLVPLLAITGSLSHVIPAQHGLIIVYPHNGSLWHTGEPHHVTWHKDPNDKNITHGALSLVSRGYHYDLAKDVSLAGNRTLVTIPVHAIPGQYQVMLNISNGGECYSDKFSVEWSL